MLNRRIGLQRTCSYEQTHMLRRMLYPFDFEDMALVLATNDQHLRDHALMTR